MPIAFGANSVASALGSSAKRDLGAADRPYHGRPFRPLETGTFYFARIRNFLLCLDSVGVSQTQAGSFVWLCCAQPRLNAFNQANRLFL